MLWFFDGWAHEESPHFLGVGVGKRAGPVGAPPLLFSLSVSRALEPPVLSSARGHRVKHLTSRDSTLEEVHLLNLPHPQPSLPAWWPGSASSGQALLESHRTALPSFMKLVTCWSRSQIRRERESPMAKHGQACSLGGGGMPC